MNRRFLISASLALVAALSGFARGEGWGDLTATFKYDGTAPTGKALDVAKEPGCKPHKLVDETWTVNKENGGVADVIVWLSLKAGDKKPPVHDDYKKSEADLVSLDNNKCRFEPRVVVLRTSQLLEVKNTDGFGHNTNISTVENPGQNFILPAGGKVKAAAMKKEERLPTSVACNIHPWMKAMLVVKDHPYVGVSDKDGKVTIKNVPAGSWSFQIWQEGVGYLQDVKQNDKAVKWSKGKVDVNISEGKPTDLGVIKFKAKGS